MMTGELAPARHIPSAASFAGNPDQIDLRCIASSGFDIQSDLLSVIPHIQQNCL
jgi:hypothetical protein